MRQANMLRGDDGALLRRPGSAKVPEMASAHYLVLCVVFVLASSMVCVASASSPCGAGASWWPEFEETVYKSRIWDAEFLTRLQTPETRAAAKMDVAEFLFNISSFAGYGIPGPDELQNSKRPVDLAAQLNCSHPDYNMMLSGQQRDKPRRVAWATLFNAETHVLGLRLHMYHDIVDYFVLSEGTLGHQSFVRKPLVFEHFKSKLLKFLPQIIHLVHDDRTAPGGMDAISGHVNVGTDWKGEKVERAAVLSYVRDQLGFGDDDLLVYGDQDEFIGEDYLYHLKHCEFRADAKQPFSSNSPFMMGDFRFGFFTDWPTSKHFGFSLKFPSVWTMKEYKKQGTDARHYMVSGSPYPKRPEGFHLTSAPFLPALYAKYIQNAEAGVHFTAKQVSLHRNASYWCEELSLGLTCKQWPRRMVPAECLHKLYGAGFEPPWLVKQNPQAFPWLFLNTAPVKYCPTDTFPCPGSIEEVLSKHGAGVWQGPS